MREYIHSWLYCVHNIRIVVLDDALLINKLISENDRYRIMLPILHFTRTVTEVLKVTKMRLCKVKFIYKEKLSLRSAQSPVVDRLNASYLQWDLPRTVLTD
jgi:hypothetical protein